MAVTMKRLVEESEDVNDITDLIGHYGKWQKIVFTFMFFMGFPAAWNNLVLTFMAPSDVDFWCARSADCQNITADDWKNLTIPVVGHDGKDHPVYDQCHRYRYNGTCAPNGSESIVHDSNATVSCKRWEYDHSFYPSTILEKWNLVCDDSWMISTSQSIYMAGVLLGTMGLGHTSDRFGRRPVLLTSYVLTISAGLLCAFSPSYVLFTITRFFLGCGKTGLFDTCFVHLMESVGPEYRSVLGVAIEFGWATGYVLLPGIVWLARDWFIIQLSITLPVILLGTMWWFLPESPRWLIAHGKTEEAEKVLEKVAKTNGLCISDLSTHVRNLVAKGNQSSGKQVKHGTVFDLLKFSNIRWKALILSLNWFVISFVFYGISLHTSSLGGNTFLNFFISGAVEFPGYFVCIFIVKKLGRRLPLTSSVIGAGVACILTIPVPDDLHWLKITFAMMGKFSVTIAFAIIYIYTAEVYPTVVRNIGLSSGSFCSGVGSVLAPFVKELGEYTHPYVPMALFGGLAIVAGVFILRLPETHNISLSDTINQERCDYQTIRRSS